jgi:5-methylthioribose kinase
MNEVALVVDALGKEAIFKYAPPYLRMLGPCSPLDQTRIHAEMHTLAYFSSLSPQSVPRLLWTDEANFTMLLEYKKEFILLREAHMKGQFTPAVYAKLGDFVGKLYAHTPPENSAGYYENATLKAITDTYVFTIAFEPNAPKALPHSWFTPLAKSPLLLENVATLKALFHAPHSHLIHGDLHTGSVLIQGEEIAVIDAEFALFGPISFDIGNVMAHCIMDSFGRDVPLQKALEAFWSGFVKTAGLTCKATQAALFAQSVGFCGIEIARRLVVPAKSPALEALENKQAAYAHMDALSCQLIEHFSKIKTLQDLLGELA